MHPTWIGGVHLCVRGCKVPGLLIVGSFKGLSTDRAFYYGMTDTISDIESHTVMHELIPATEYCAVLVWSNDPPLKISTFWAVGHSSIFGHYYVPSFFL